VECKILHNTPTEIYTRCSTHSERKNDWLPRRRFSNILGSWLRIPFTNLFSLTLCKDKAELPKTVQLIPTTAGIRRLQTEYSGSAAPLTQTQRQRRKRSLYQMETSLNFIIILPWRLLLAFRRLGSIISTILDTPSCKDSCIRCPFD